MNSFSIKKSKWIKILSNSKIKMPTTCKQQSQHYLEPSSFKPSRKMRLSMVM